MAGGTIIVLHRFVLSRPPVTISKDIRAKLSYPIYVPKKLPGNFHILPPSITIAEQDVVIFRAEDGTDSSITFSEQKRPKDLNFTEFYQQSIKDGKIIENSTTYPAFLGKTFDNKTNILSIVTPETWILATTRTPISQEQSLTLINSLYRYK